MIWSADYFLLRKIKKLYHQNVIFSVTSHLSASNWQQFMKLSRLDKNLFTRSFKCHDLGKIFNFMISSMIISSLWKFDTTFQQQNDNDESFRETFLWKTFSAELIQLKFLLWNLSPLLLIIYYELNQEKWNFLLSGGLLLNVI